MGLKDRVAMLEQAKQHRDPNALLPGMTGPFMMSDTKVVDITPEKLHPFAGHTFQVQTNSPDFLSLEQSVLDHGLQSPILVRPHAEKIGDYEIISGHRRHQIALRLGLSEVACMVQPCDNDTAIQLMGVSNIQRPGWLPSEKARTYKAHLEATQRKTETKQGTRSDLTSATRLPKSRNRDEAAKVWGTSGQMLDMYIKLNDLTPTLLQYTDEGRIPVKGAYQLAFLSSVHQTMVEEILNKYPKKKLSEAKEKEIREESENSNESFVFQVLGVQAKTKKEEKKSPFLFPLL